MAKKTEYRKGIYNGVQYDSEKEAINAAAVSRARMEFTSVKKTLEKMKLKFSEKKLIQALYEMRREQIIETLKKQDEKRNSIPEVTDLD
jgi:hypothetical protein